MEPLYIANRSALFWDIMRRVVNLWASRSQCVCRLCWWLVMGCEGGRNVVVWCLCNPRGRRTSSGVWLSWFEVLRMSGYDVEQPPYRGVLCLISGFRREVVISQKSADLIFIAMVAWDHVSWEQYCMNMEQNYLIFSLVNITLCHEFPVENVQKSGFHPLNKQTFSQDQDVRPDPALILLASCQQTCVTYTIAVCRVKNCWWWTEELSETCRVLFQK